jgi:hypothetical protein
MSANSLIYLYVAGFLFAIGIFIGKVLKKDILHGGVLLGFFNSVVLALAWPLTLSVFVLGVLHDTFKEYKRL